MTIWSRIIFRMKAVIFIRVLYLILIETRTAKGAAECESKVELRAVLLNCPTRDSGCDEDDPLSQPAEPERGRIQDSNSKNADSVKGNKGEEFPNVIVDCKRKLIISLKIKNRGKIPCDDEYVVVDHVFDPVTGGKARLLSPVVLKLRQEQMIQLYALHFQRVVNSDPFEEEKGTDKVCSVDPEDPTCGIATYDGKPIPFSEGFCCSCDPNVNAKRQLSPVSHGDAFLYRDSKLISQAKDRFVREEKSLSAIVNPELIRLKSGDDAKAGGCGREDDAEDDVPEARCPEIKELTPEKLPNFFYELDRKIVCGRGDFLGELCKLHNLRKCPSDKTTTTCYPVGRKGKSKNYLSLAKNSYANEEMDGADDRDENAVSGEPESTTLPETALDGAGSNAVDADGLDASAILKDLVGAPGAADQSTKNYASLEKQLFELYNQIKTSRKTRGKREDRNESGSTKTKNLLSSRRKRLSSELSGKRFRKSDNRCKAGGEEGRTELPREDYIRAPPPKYFFSHDKYIVDPPEPYQPTLNSTFKSSDETDYDDSWSDEQKKIVDPYRSDAKKKFKDKESKQTNGSGFAKSKQESPAKGETKAKSKEKYEKNVAFEAEQKEKIPEDAMCKMESEPSKGKDGAQAQMPLSPAPAQAPSAHPAPPQPPQPQPQPQPPLPPLESDKNPGKSEGNEKRERSETKASTGENLREEERAKNKEKLEDDDFENHKSSKGRFNAKSIKNFFVKSDEKKMDKAKQKNSFADKNQAEKQKLRTDLIKEIKKQEMAGNEEMEKSNSVEKKPQDEQPEDILSPDKLQTETENNNRSPAKAEEKDANPISGNRPETKTEEEKPSNSAVNTVKPIMDKPDLKLGPLGHESLNEDSTRKTMNLVEHESSAAENAKGETQKDFIFSGTLANKDESENVAFDVEIINKHYPELSNSRLYSSKAELRMANQQLSGEEPMGEIRARKTPSSKNRANVLPRHKPVQKYHALDGERSPFKRPLRPNEVFFVRSEGGGALAEVKNGNRHGKHQELGGGGGGSKGVAKDRGYRDFEAGEPRAEHEMRFHGKKSAKHHYSPAADHKKSKLQRTRQSYDLLAYRERDQYRGKGYPEEFFRKRPEFPGKSRLRPEDEIKEMVPGSKVEKVRVRRAAGYAFEPARGFFGSELESLEDEDFQTRKNLKIIHELENCGPAERMAAGKTGRTENWRDKITGWQFSRSESDNFSYDSDAISGVDRSRFVFDHPFISSKKEIRVSKVTADLGNLAKTKRDPKGIRDKERLIRSYLNAPDYVLEEIEAGLKGKREVKDGSKRKIARESMSCQKSDFSGDTAHCMRFGDLWYSVYSIKKPIVSQLMGIQLYEKHSLYDGTTQWRDITRGKMIRIGTFLPKAEDDLPTISVSFSGAKTTNVESAIDPDNYLLLIPSHVSDPSKVGRYPQFEGGPAEYLVVRSKDISPGGDCNMIGTSFEAFARQPDRCSRPRGSCLKRQPVDLWREDMEARIRGKRGKYFVENFGTVPDSTIKTYANITGDFLALEYYGDYSSTLEIELKADYNTIVRKGSTAQILAVYIDCTHSKKTRIVLSVLNIGLTSANFRPRLGDCPPDLDPAWCPLEGPLVLIPPQQRHDFKLDLSGALPQNKIYVTVQVLNQANKKIAYRKIIINKGDRCVCAFHCKCNCIGNLVDGKICHRLSAEDYKGAGYGGSFPFRGGASKSSSESILKNLHVVFLTAAYVLLLLGIVKGILGIFFRRIGVAGTRVIVGPRQLRRYYEYELRCCSVLFDECGFPVHPTTFQPVQVVPLGIWFLILFFPCCKTFCSDCEGCCKHDENSDYYHKCSYPLLSKDRMQPANCMSYNLTTNNTKKGKADEYLPYLPYKGDDDPLEEDDTEFVLQEMKRYRKK